MKKIFMYGALLCLLLAMYSPVDARQPQGNLPPIEIVEQSGDTVFAINVKDINGVRRFRVQHDGAISVYDSSGATAYSVDPQGRVNQDKVVYLSTITDFSTWGGAASGSCYYQMLVGRTYIVDPVALLLGNANVPLVTGGGVTLHLPLAASGSDYTDSTVIWAQGSDSGSSDTVTPLFDVQVWPAPLSGATSFREDGVLGSQNMTLMANSGASPVTTGYTGSYNINSVGQFGTWKLINNSAVSAVMLNNAVMIQ